MTVFGHPTISVPIIISNSSASRSPENSEKKFHVEDHFSWQPSKREQIQILNNKKKPNAGKDRGSGDANRSTPAPLLRLRDLT